MVTFANVDTTIHVSCGVLSTLLVHAALWSAAFSVARAWPAQITLADRLLVAFSVALFQSVAITLAAAAVGMMTPVVVGGLSLAISAALLFFTDGWRQLKTFKAEIAEASGNRIKEIAQSEPLTIVASAPGIVFFLVVFSYAVIRPPMGYDPLNYHLTIAATAFQSGTFPVVFFPPYFDLYAWFPANGAVFTLWTIMWMGCDLWLPFVNLPFLLALFLAIYLLAKDLGLCRSVSVALTSAFLTMPLFAMLATEAYVELPLWAMFFVASRFALLAARLDSNLFFFVAGLCGLMIGTKTTGFLLAILVFAWYAIAAFRLNSLYLQCLFRSSIFLFAGVVLFGSYFYIRNYLLSGNPLYPYPVRLAGFEIFKGQADLDVVLSRTTVLGYLDFWQDLGRIFYALIGDTTKITKFSWSLGPTGFAALLIGPPFALCGLFLSRYRREYLILTIAGLVIVLAWLFLPFSGEFLLFNVRFVWPGVVLFGLLATSAFISIFQPQPFILVALILALQTSSFFFTHAPVSATTGGILACTLVIVGFTMLLARISRRLGVKIEGFSFPASRPRLAFVVASMLAITILVVAFWHEHREQTRVASYREATDQLLVSEYADCLAAVERQVPRGTLAVALEAQSHGFLYPLFGSHFQRQVIYIHNGPEDSRLHSDYPSGNPRQSPDKDAWLRHLALAAPDALLVFLNPVEGSKPIESTWAESRADLFQVQYRSPWCELYRVEKLRLPSLSHIIGQ